MKKIFKQQIADRGSEAVSKISSTIFDEFSYTVPSKFSLVIMTAWFKILCYLFDVVLSILLIVAAVRVSPAFLIIIISVLIATFVLIDRGKRIKRDLDKKIYEYHLSQVPYINKAWFDLNYEDISVSGYSDKELMSDFALLHRPAIVSDKAIITNIKPYFSFEGKNGSVIHLAVVTWTWHTSTITGDDIVNVQKVKFALVSNIKDTFDSNFDFWMKINNKKYPRMITSLENEMFDKKWHCWRNNEVKARMILTPSVQEEIMNHISDSTFEIKKIVSNFAVSEKIFLEEKVLTAEKEKIYPYHSKELIVSFIVSRTLTDVLEMQRILRDVTIFRTLFKTI